MKAPANREETIFHALLQLPPDRRDACLAAACEGDPQLRARVSELLQAHARSEAFFQKQALGIATGQELPTQAEPPADGPGTIIGRYKLREKIGEGGCGIVYVAEQEEPVRRRVALKVIKLGMDTKSVVARFEAERQALAMMDHPNIAKVLDAGATETGRPYFVMELVRGIKITDYCDQNNLSTRERLDLFIKVCQAVQHAHQKGIIHRDLKPSNILVTLHDGTPVPKVIDFGIAKATEGRLTDLTIYTELYQFIGTPAYMSPEQAEMSGLDIDTRSDIYSLGVLLYELLTGRPPFDAKELIDAGLDEMRRTIREKEPSRPSTRLSTMSADELTTTAKRRAIDGHKLVHLLRGDLDWIVMKALEKDRTRRYETANGFAADLQRYLTSEPIIARPPSAIYKFQKAVRRNRLAYAAAGAILVALTTGLIGTQVQATRARRAEALANTRLAEVSAERDAKEQARKDAEAISKFLQEVFQSPDPQRDGRTVTVAETLDRARSRLESEFSGDRDHRARLQTTLAQTYGSLGIYSNAAAILEQVRDHWVMRFGADDRRSLSAMHELAGFYLSGGRREEARKIQEDVLARVSKGTGADREEQITIAKHGLARIYQELGLRDQAIKLGEEVWERQRTVHGVKHPQSLTAMLNLAGFYDDAGRIPEAVNLLEQLLPLTQEINGAKNPVTLKCINNLANAYASKGRRVEAMQLREKLLSAERSIYGPEHPRTVFSMYNLAISYDGSDRNEDALKLREEVLSLARRVLGFTHPFVIRATRDVAESYRKAGRRNEAIKLLEECVELSKKGNGPDHPQTLVVLTSLANAYFAAGRLEEALALREKVLDLNRRVNGGEHPSTLFAMSNLALSYGKAGRPAEALKLHEDVLGFRWKVHGAEHPDTVWAIHNVADCYVAAEKWDQAIKAQEEMLPLSRKVIGNEHSDTLHFARDLATSYRKTGRISEAIRTLQEIWDANKKISGPAQTDILHLANELVSSYRSAGRTNEAIQTLREIWDASRNAYGPTDRRAMLVGHNVGRAYSLAGQTEAASDVFRNLTNHALRRWLVLAPIPYADKNAVKALDDEQISSLAGLRPSAGDQLKIGALELGWQAFESEDFVLDFQLFLREPIEYAVAYAACYLVSEKEEKGVVMAISSDDQAKVYLNGKEIYRNAAPRGLGEAEDKVQNLELKAGSNVLLIKIVNGNYDWQSSISLTDASGQPLKTVRVTLDPKEN